MTLPALTPAQRLVPVLLAVMVGAVALVALGICVALLGWGWGLAGPALMTILVVAGLALLSRVTQHHRRG